MWYEIIKKIKYIFFCCLSRLVSTQKSGFQQIKNVENVKTVYPAWLAVVKLGSERVIESKATLTRQQLNFRLAEKFDRTSLRSHGNSSIFSLCSHGTLNA